MMGFFDRFKRKKDEEVITNENIETIFIKKIDPYTGIVLYYECVLDSETRTATSKLLDIEPNNKIIYDLDDIRDTKYDVYNPIIMDSINKCNVLFNSQFEENENFFQMVDLYKINESDKSEKVLLSCKMYEELRNKLLLKCKNLNIEIECDKNKKINSIINNICSIYEIETVKKGFKTSLDINFCYSEDSIDKEVFKQIQDKTYNTRKFTFAEFYLKIYFASYINNFSHLLKIIDKDNLTKDEKNILKNYTELFNILPTFIGRLDYLDTCVIKMEDIKTEKNKNKLEQNHQFMDDLTKLLSKVNSDYEYIYIHATTSENAAKSILDKGLYVDSDELDSFSFPYQNIDQILTYQYGGVFSTNQADSYIVIFRISKDDGNLVNLTKEEIEEAKSFINMRRNILLPTPTKKVIPSNILGFVDKKNMQVVYNNNFMINNYSSTKVK